MTSHHANRLPWPTWLLATAQALNVTAAVLSVTVAAVVGSKLAATPALGTLPYGLQFAAVMACTYPASALMRRYGRRIVFSGGALLLMAGGATGYLAARDGSFALLIAAHLLLGAYFACANFYRFAAVDTLAPALKPRALSLVVAGGVLAAIAGPALASALRQVTGFADFSLCYAAFAGLGVLTLGLMAAWPHGSRPAAQPTQPVPAAHTGAPAAAGLVIAAAIASAAGGYLLMNLLMVQASLVLKDICSFDAASRAIQAHVLAMFVPSFFTGSLIAAIGLRRGLTLGFALLIGAAAFGMAAPSYEAVLAGLVLVGLGWNLLYIGGGTLLAQQVSEAQRHRWQGINDTLVAACGTAGAFLPAPMLAAFGWQGSNLAALPLCVAGIVLCLCALPAKRNALAAAH